MAPMGNAADLYFSVTIPYLTKWSCRPKQNSAHDEPAYHALTWATEIRERGGKPVTSYEWFTSMFSTMPRQEGKSSHVNSTVNQRVVDFPLEFTNSRSWKWLSWLARMMKLLCIHSLIWLSGSTRNKDWCHETSSCSSFMTTSSEPVQFGNTHLPATEWLSRHREGLCIYCGQEEQLVSQYLDCQRPELPPCHLHLCRKPWLITHSTHSSWVHWIPWGVQQS